MKYLKVWTDFKNVLAPLNDAEIGRLFLAMLNYAATGEEPSGFEGNEVFLWAVAKRDIDTMSEKAETFRANGLKGGRPKTKQNQTEPEETEQNQTEPNESLKEKKRKEKKGNENKTPSVCRFTPPTVDEVKAYCRERNNTVDAERFVDFYASKGWKVGNQPMRDWKAAVRTWERGSPATVKPVQKLNAQNYGQRDYSHEDEDALKRWAKMG